MTEKCFCQCWDLFEDEDSTTSQRADDGCIWLKCNCGIDAAHTPEWRWSSTDKSNTACVYDDNCSVNFHDEYSSGNSCIRGDTPFTKGNHYYWEIKMLRPVFGSSVMVGIGTDIVDLNKDSNRFCHMLGFDDQSWGLTYLGLIRHAGISKIYHPSAGFQLGSIVGLHLDMWSGTLEFFLNREPLGVAFTGLKDKVLYPMASSTAAKVSMKIVHASIIPHSLSYLAQRAVQPEQARKLPFRLQNLYYKSWWLLPKAKKKLEKRKRPCKSPKNVYLVVASDDEEHEDVRALKRRMRKVLENSKCSRIGSQRHRHRY